MPSKYANYPIDKSTQDLVQRQTQLRNLKTYLGQIPMTAPTGFQGTAAERETALDNAYQRLRAVKAAQEKERADAMATQQAQHKDAVDLMKAALEVQGRLLFGAAANMAQTSSANAEESGKVWE